MTRRTAASACGGSAQAVLAERLGHRGEHGRHRRQVIGAVAPRAEVAVELAEDRLQLIEGGAVGVVARHVPEMGDQLGPPGQASGIASIIRRRKSSSLISVRATPTTAKAAASSRRRRA